MNVADLICALIAPDHVGEDTKHLSGDVIIFTNSHEYEILSVYLSQGDKVTIDIIRKGEEEL